MSWVEHEEVIGLGPSFEGTEGTSTHVISRLYLKLVAGLPLLHCALCSGLG